MRQIIEWLIEIEKIAYTFYIQSSAQFDDPDIRTFLELAAQDEAFHYRTMSKAMEIANRHPEWNSEISLDPEVQTKVEACFKRNQLKVNDRALTTESLIDCIVETELSEWNHLFSYVVNALKTRSPEFKDAAARIQQHLRQTERFISSQPYGQKKLAPLKELKPVWREKILIVDDNPEILTLLAAVLKDDGIVETAENGKIALDKARKSYYRLIISDVDMPIMNGLDFYQEASVEFPDIRQRFVFLTGGPTPATIDFFDQHQLRYLIKPISIKQIRDLFFESMQKISIAS